MANAVGQALGGTLGCGATFLIANTIFSAGGACNTVIGGAIFGAIVGAVTGTMQWIVIGRESYPVKKWVLASLVGGAMGWAIVWFLAMSLLLSATGLD